MEAVPVTNSHVSKRSLAENAFRETLRESGGESATASHMKGTTMANEMLAKSEQRQKSRICRWWKDGSVSIEWVDHESGEKVVGDFVQIGPTQSSAEFAARTDKMLRSAAALSYYLRR